MNKNKLYIAYFYKQDGEIDAVNFVAKEGKEYSQFKKYAEWAWDVKIKDGDILGVYEVGCLENCDGKEYNFEYKLTVKK